ncbi:acyl- n-acyltransferase [Trichoderma arundinaceum]|uniref:Histone acetyltransferase n=1 Tax=Trichoderma arundinaceum TaxID=490622 RepID=A0A395N8C0_TRIAR|nr:acyl- n-acyltransferase [Trichoderma arundinaceum]
MSSAQLMEEELQQSVMLSEDADYETADTAGEDALTPAALRARTIIAGSSEIRIRGHDGMEVDEDDDEELSDRDASGEEIDEEMDQDAEGEDYTELVDQQIVVSNGRPLDMNDDEDDEADGEEDGDEGVGAVKIKPGDTDDEDEDDEDAEDDAESDVSDLLSVAEDDSDEEPAWEEAGEVEEDDESETGPSNICMFCKQDEENDPSEDFETFLICSRCSENAHQQCARDAAAMSEQNNAKHWKCPDCDNGDSDQDEPEERERDASIDGETRLESQLSDAPPDLSPGHQMQEDEEVEPNHDDLASHAEASDEPRMLRKRKTSSLEPEEATIALRRRRRGLSADATSANEDTDSKSAEQTRGSSRAVRLKVSRPSLVVVEKKSRMSLVVKMRVRAGNLKEILSRRRRERRRSGANGRPPRTPVAPSSAVRPNSAAITATPALPTPFTTDFYSTPFYSLFDKETEDMKGKPYGGILTEPEADTSKTLPQPDDRRRFDQAKQRAEDEWRARVLAMQAEIDMPVRRSKKSSDNASQIECIEFGGWEIDTWYAAPYPAEYSRNRVLYICEFCLKYMNSDYVAWRHKLKCAAKHPPGDEIYRHGSVSVFEVDGRKNPVYCQNLCLLAKLFLGSKTLYYDVEPFLFYVLCEYDDCGYHFVGYFSKEKRASSQNNVSCILTLPIHQRKGYGNLLIDFSYLLTKVEEKTGSPEKPLSDMGLVSYRNYWRLRLCRYFIEALRDDEHKQNGLSIRQISDDTGMTPDDVIAALEGLRALVRDPQTKVYAFRIDLEYCRQYVAKWESKGYVQLKPEALAWTPYVMGRSNAVNFELGPPINTIAPREDDEAKLEEGANGISGETHSIIMNGELNDGSQSRVGSASETGESSNSNPGFTPILSIEEKMAPENKENTGPQDEVMDDVDSEPDWMTPYRDIPPSRFEVFPPVAGGRRADRSRQSVGRPLGSRTAPNSARPRPKRAGGSSRRPTVSRPRSSGSRRRTGGTGRGPGRWPKGTKKSDYGNADSGPGLPPGWRDKLPSGPDVVTDGDRSVTTSLADEEPAKDEVRVMTPQPSSNGFVMSVQLGGQVVEPSDQGINGGDEEELDVDAEGEDE